MNRLLTFPGTQPVYLGDVDFMQDAVADAVKQLAKALMNADSDNFNAILQGVEVQSGALTPGVVVLNGELLPFEGAQLGEGFLYFHVESTLSGERVFKDGESHSCLNTRKAVANTTSAGGVLVNSVPRLHVPSDDRVYDNGSLSGFITDAKVIKKNGFWFLSLDVDIPASSALTGSAQFYNLPSEAKSALLNFAASATIVLIDDELNKGLQQMVCYTEVTSDADTIYFSISGGQSASGEGKYSTMLPIN